MRQTIQSINHIAKFLAKRDLNQVDKDTLLQAYNIEKIDLLILLGNAIPYTVGCAAQLYKKGLCHQIMVVGGMGHSTKLLWKTIEENTNYKDIATQNRAEADIFKDILVKIHHIPEEDIIVENKSTNCGDNAIKAVQLLDKLNRSPQSILLIQDPTMQLRSHMSFERSLEGKEITVISYAPFIPKLTSVSGAYKLSNEEIEGIWEVERFVSLVMGEIPRLTDDEKGYGPRGAGFIGHVDIPKSVIACYKEELR